MKQIILASNSTSNNCQQINFNFLRDSLKKPERPWLPKDVYGQINSQKRDWFDKTTKEHRPIPSYERVLDKLTFLTNIDGIGHPSAETLHRMLEHLISYDTVRRALKFWVERGVLEKTRSQLTGIKRGFKKPPSIYRLVGFKAMLVDSKCTVQDNLTIQDLKPITYMHPPSDDRPKNVCTPPPIKKKTFSPVTHIDKEKLKAPTTRKAEIIRACHSRGLDEPNTQYAVERMGKDLSGVVCEAAFLAAMLKALQTNSWNKVEKQKPDSGLVKAKQAELKSQELFKKMEQDKHLAASPEVASEFLRKMRASINLPGG
jgi:hypothetical protein